MALLIRNVPVQTQKKSGFDYGIWYQENKKRLSDKRARRYKEDSDYRNAALKRSVNQRQNKVIESDPEGFTISLTSLAEDLGVSIWVIREWRRKSYFPEPRFRNGRLWFKENQIGLLWRLKDFFETHGVRTSSVDRQSLDDLISLVYSNW